MPVLPNAPLPGNSLTGSFFDQAGQAIASSGLGAFGLSQASGRKNVAQMYQYGNKTNGPAPAIIFPNASQDWRVRLSLPPYSTYFYNDPSNSLLSPLSTTPSGAGAANSVAGLVGGAFNLTGNQTIGVIFPYTPQISITHTANYSQQKLTHSNYANYFYDSSEVQAITLNADFTVQSIDEGQYLLAVIYFFRSVTKMFFGKDRIAGNPPPILYLNGYGQYYLPNVPCVVTSFNHSMPSDCDYIDVPEPFVTRTSYNPQFTRPRLNSTRLPTTSTISLSLQPVYSRVSQSTGYSLEDFARGALINPVNKQNKATSFGASQPSKLGIKNVKNGGFL